VIDGQNESIRKVDLTEYYENSDQFRSVQGQLEPIAGSAVSRRNGETPSYATGFLWQVNFLKVLGSSAAMIYISCSLSLPLSPFPPQMLIVGIRSITNLLRNPMSSVIQVSHINLIC
jgi:hypothetical protein